MLAKLGQRITCVSYLFYFEMSFVSLLRNYPSILQISFSRLIYWVYESSNSSINYTRYPELDGFSSNSWRLNVSFLFAQFLVCIFENHIKFWDTIFLFEIILLMLGSLNGLGEEKSHCWLPSYCSFRLLRFERWSSQVFKHWPFREMSDRCSNICWKGGFSIRSFCYLWDHQNSIENCLNQNRQIIDLLKISSCFSIWVKWVINFFSVVENFTLHCARYFQATIVSSQQFELTWMFMRKLYLG